MEIERIRAFIVDAGSPTTATIQTMPAVRLLMLPPSVCRAWRRLVPLDFGHGATSRNRHATR